MTGISQEKEEKAFKEVAPILCLALSATSLATVVHDRSDIHCSGADINRSPTENKDSLNTPQTYHS